MRNFNKISEDVYQFIGGDVNPLAKRIDENGNYADDIYNKDQIIEELKKAKETGLVDSTKIFDVNEKQIAYIFVVKSDDKKQAVKLLLDNPNYLNSEKEKLLLENDKPLSNKYMDELSALADNSVKLNKVNFNKIAAVIVTGAVMGTLSFLVVKGAEKEAQIDAEKSKNYMEEVNSERQKNGLAPLGSSYIEDVVDQEINNLSEGKKL